MAIQGQPRDEVPVATIVEVSIIETRGQVPGTKLIVMADAALIWTQYRGPDGRLVVEIPDTRVADAVKDLAPSSGPIASVSIERVDGSRGPLTRVTIATRGSAGHFLRASGDSLVLRFTPSETRSADLSRSGSEPKPSAGPERDRRISEAVPSRPQTVEERVAEPAIESPSPDWPGTPQVPFRARKAPGVRASVLERVELLRARPETVVQIIGDGQFEYSSFQLDSPERFVLDLVGVRKVTRESSLGIDGPVVDRIRVAQFRSDSEPVTRIVFDLSDRVAPTIARGPTGLRVHFPSPAESGRPSALEPVAEEGAAGRTIESLSADRGDAAVRPFAPTHSVRPTVEPCLILRQGPGLGWGRIDCLDGGTELESKEALEGWMRVRVLDGREGWVSRAFLVDPRL